MNGCTFPGRMISCADAACFGKTTDTAVRATCSVSAFSIVRALTRDQMPETNRAATAIDRKSTRLNSSHSQISYAVFCLKKKKNKRQIEWLDMTSADMAGIANS